MTTWFPAVDETFARANTSYGGAGSTNVGQATLGPPTAPWVDVTGNTWKIVSDVGNGVGGFETAFLLRPAAEVALSQRVLITAATGSTSTSDWWVCLRYIDASNWYVCNLRKITSTTVRVDVYRFLAGALLALGNSGNYSDALR